MSFYMNFEVSIVLLLFCFGLLIILIRKMIDRGPDV